MEKLEKAYLKGEEIQMQCDVINKINEIIEVLNKLDRLVTNEDKLKENYEEGKSFYGKSEIDIETEKTKKENEETMRILDKTYIDTFYNSKEELKEYLEKNEVAIEHEFMDSKNYMIDTYQLREKFNL